MEDSRRAGALGKGRGVRPTSGLDVKDQQVTGGSVLGAIVEACWTRTGKGVGGAGGKGRARVDGRSAKERVQIEPQNRVGTDGLNAKGRIAESSVRHSWYVKD